MLNSKGLLKNKHLNTMVVDLSLVISGIISLLSANGVSFGIETASSTEIMIMYLGVICLVPWHMGYLFQYFESFSSIVQKIIKWSFGLITLSLVVFLIVTMMPLMEDKEELSSGELFLFSFGLFFLVLGPMMVIGGYADGASIDESRDPQKPYFKPIFTGTMGIITLSIAYLILIVGYFDPKWEGNANFLVIILAFILGPLGAILTLIPFMIIFRQLEKVDVYRIVPNLLYILLPVATFQVLIWWNDIVLLQLSPLWDDTPSISQIIWSMILAGIIPFRLIMLIKPPFKVTGLIFGLIALGVYVLGILKSYGAI